MYVWVKLGVPVECIAHMSRGCSVCVCVHACKTGQVCNDHLFVFVFASDLGRWVTIAEMCAGAWNKVTG